MFPPRPGPGMGSRVQGLEKRTPRKKGSPRMEEGPPTQQQLPAPLRSREPMSTLSGSPAGLGRRAGEGVGAAGRRQGIGHADSGLSRSLRELGRGQAARSPSLPTPPGPPARPPCPLSNPTAVPPALCSRRTSGALTRPPLPPPPPPPAARGSGCLFSRYRSASRLRLGAWPTRGRGLARRGWAARVLPAWGSTGGDSGTGNGQPCSV
jgi:hypothetical protein